MSEDGVKLWCVKTQAVPCGLSRRFTMGLLNIITRIVRTCLRYVVAKGMVKKTSPESFRRVRPVLSLTEGTAAAILVHRVYSQYESTAKRRPACAKLLSAFVASSAKEARRRQGTPLADFSNIPTSDCHENGVEERRLQ